MPSLCEAGLQYKKTAGGCVTSGSVDTGFAPPQSPGVVAAAKTFAQPQTGGEGLFLEL